MRLALTLLCISAVIFLLRVVVALVKEWVSLSRGTVKVYVAKFNPSGRRGELIVMNFPGSKGGLSTGTNERIAL